MDGQSSEPLRCYLDKEIEMDKVVCRFYVNDQCEDGDKCIFPHVPKEGRVLDSACRYFLRNKCHFGKYCALDHVMIDERDGTIVLQIIQQQLGARKRQMESQSLVVKEPLSSIMEQHACLVGDSSFIFPSDILSESTNANTPGLSKQCAANKKCLPVGSIKPILKCKDRKMRETKNHLKKFRGIKFLQARSVPSSKKASENSRRSLEGSTQSDSESGGHQTGEAIAAESDSEDLLSCGTPQTPVQSLLVKRSEEELHPRISSSESDSEREDQNLDGPFAAVNRSRARGSPAASQNLPGGFDPDVPMVLYKTFIVARGRTAEEIALFSEYSFLPVDNESRVPLYMRGAAATEPIPEYVGKQTENAAKEDENNVTEQAENAKKADEKNGLSQQHIAGEKFIYTPSGRRIGVNRQHYSYSPYQDRM